jgi:hypothetical protein
VAWTIASSARRRWRRTIAAAARSAVVVADEQRGEDVELCDRGRPAADEQCGEELDDRDGGDPVGRRRRALRSRRRPAGGAEQRGEDLELRDQLVHASASLDGRDVCDHSHDRTLTGKSGMIMLAERAKNGADEG